MKPPTEIVMTARLIWPGDPAEVPRAERVYRVSVTDDLGGEDEFVCLFGDVPARVSESLAGMVNA